MTELVLVALAAAWLVALWPAARRARRSTPLFTAETWRRRMRSIAPRGGRWVLSPTSSGATDRGARRAARARRRRLMWGLVALVALVPLTAVAGFLRAGVWWDVHVASYGVLAVYVALLVETRRRQDDARAKVRSLQARRARHLGEREFRERRA